MLCKSDHAYKETELRFCPPRADEKLATISAHDASTNLKSFQLTAPVTRLPVRPPPSLRALLPFFPPASWLRLKYPHIVDGAIAASAPVLALEGLRRPTPDPEAFAETVTRAAGPAGGASEACAGNVRRAFSVVLSPSTARSSSSRSSTNERNDGFRDVKDAEAAVAEAAADVARALRVCPGQEPQGEDALVELAWWARAAFDYLAMGNYPYATGYILNSGEGGVELPPWPLRTACSHLADPALQVRKTPLRDARQAATKNEGTNPSSLCDH